MGAKVYQLERFTDGRRSKFAKIYQKQNPSGKLGKVQIIVEDESQNPRPKKLEHRFHVLHHADDVWTCDGYTGTLKGCLKSVVATAGVVAFLPTRVTDDSTMKAGGGVG